MGISAQISQKQPVEERDHVALCLLLGIAAQMREGSVECLV